ncbi:uncharacterized protein RBU33_013899 isoform 1-T2 [Hipposideros larvatus]
MVSATTRSAAVKGLVHVAVQPLIAELWFPLLLRGPSPARPAPPGSRARTRRAPGRTRGGGTTRRGRPPALPRAGRPPLSPATSATGGRRHARVGAESSRRPALALARCVPAASRWYLPSYTFPMITSELGCKRGALAPTTFCAFRLAGRTNAFVS